MSWNSNYVNLLNFIDKSDKEFSMLFNKPDDIVLHVLGDVQDTLDVIKKLYECNLSISIDEFYMFKRNLEFDYKIFTNHNTNVTVRCIDYTTNNILIKELELKIAYSRVKQKYVKLKNK